MKRRIRAVHKFTGETLNLYYTDLYEARRRNPALTGFQYVV